MKPRRESPRPTSLPDTLGTPSPADPDAGLPSLAHADYLYKGRERKVIPKGTWAHILDVPLPPLPFAERRSAFGVALRQRIQPFIFGNHRHPYLFPDSSGKVEVIRRTATVLDGIGLTASDIETLAGEYGITAGALRDETAVTKSLSSLFEDIGVLAQISRETHQTCIRVGRGIETYLALQPEHFDGETILQRALGAFHRLRTESVISHFPIPPRS